MNVLSDELIEPAAIISYGEVGEGVPEFEFKLARLWGVSIYDEERTYCT